MTIAAQKQRSKLTTPYLYSYSANMELSADERFRAAMMSFQSGRLRDAERDFKEILKHHPQHLAALNLLGVLLISTQNFVEAERYLKKALQLDATSDATFSNYGIALKALNRPQEALESLTRAIAINPKIASSWNSRGTVFNDLRRYEEAIVDFDKAISLQPSYADALYNKGNSLAALGHYKDSLAAYDGALKLRPDFAQGLAGRGNVLCQLQRHEEAKASLDRAISLNPNLAEAWLGSGNVHFEFGRFGEAMGAYDHALALNPDLADAWVGRGNVYQGLIKSPEALAAYDKALALKPDLPEAWSGRGNVCFSLKHYDEALAAFGKAFALKPDMERLEGARLNAKMFVCVWENFSAEREHLINSVRSGKEAVALFPFLSISDSPADQLACARLQVQKHYPSRPALVSSNRRYDHKRIRLGYLSADFRDHPGGQTLVNLYELHDRSRFEVIGLSIGPDDEGALRKRLVKTFDQFHDLRAQTDENAAHFVRSLEVDILVKVAPHTEYSRLGIVARRPAPVQVNFTTWTSGADYIDYIIADPQTAPFEDQRYFSERIVHIPGFANDPTQEISAASLSRADQGLPDDAFVFCGFNAYYKLNPQMFDIWMRLLRRVEGSVLWLSPGHPKAIANLKNEATARGVDPSRLVFSTKLPSLSDHLARHRLADLFLDTFPYGAQTTGRDALWAGLPILTCRGATCSGRVGAAQLYGVGLPELITDSFDEYETAAIRLAQNSAELKSLRARLAANRLSSTLFDMKAMCRRFDSAYVEMWERQRRGEPPQSFMLP